MEKNPSISIPYLVLSQLSEIFNYLISFHHSTVLIYLKQFSNVFMKQFCDSYSLYQVDHPMENDSISSCYSETNVYKALLDLFISSSQVYFSYNRP